ncbi:DKNYY domain-containing protein [Flavobacterium sp. PL002]|uniref:DKNYY domain-containing protein n=1 Tax=Flavobacterium sp. PL002 TaxID=1897058 RepID=UPI00178781E7|nr:DKNYY domain-containing protein [Flavobacterium sp. PL002]MBE0391733.1 hypothetical protein [Flavobacterium sp. PL002]
MTNLEPLTQKQKKKWNKIILIILGTVLTVQFLFIFVYLFDNENNDVDLYGEILFGDFTLYQNKIYASVPSNGYYMVEQADIQTFKPISDSYYDKHMAIDKKNVYCGNQIIPTLDPSTTKSIGNNYYFDGQTAYFCAPNTIQNANLGWRQGVWKQIQYNFFEGKKPQTYLHSTTLLPKSDKPYYAILKSNTATDGSKAFYDGEIIPDAIVQSLHQLDNKYDDSDVRKSRNYFADEQSVYYKTNKLPIKSHENLYTFYIENLFNDVYLFDPTSGNVFIGNISFDKQNAPYKVVSKYGNHVNHALFLSKNGVFYYNNQNKNIEKAGENPFLNGNFTEIAPLIFSDGKKTLYLESGSIWHNSRSNKSLASRSTYIFQLDENLQANWVKIGIVSNHHYASVWKNGDAYFYFDELGDTQLIFHSIYKIKDQSTLQKLLADDIKIDKIRQLKRDKALVPVNKTKILEAKTKYY